MGMEIRWAVKRICEALDNEMKKGKNKFVIYPYGELGRLAEKVIKEQYQIEPMYMIDNRTYDGKKVLSMEQAKQLDNTGVIFLICNANLESYNQIRKKIHLAFKDEQIVDVFPKDSTGAFPKRDEVILKLKELNALLESAGI